MLQMSQWVAVAAASSEPEQDSEESPVGPPDAATPQREPWRYAAHPAAFSAPHDDRHQASVFPSQVGGARGLALRDRHCAVSLPLPSATSVALRSSLGLLFDARTRQCVSAHLPVPVLAIVLFLLRLDDPVRVVRLP